MNRVEKLEREIEIRKLAQARYAPCGGHGGKAPGGCLMCVIEKLQRDKRNLTKLLDDQLGTPCEQIRSQQEIDRLRTVLQAILQEAGRDRDGRAYYVLAQDALDGSVIAPEEKG